VRFGVSINVCVTATGVGTIVATVETGCEQPQINKNKINGIMIIFIPCGSVSQSQYLKNGLRAHYNETHHSPRFLVRVAHRYDL
jgi:hypothetical protein